MPQSDLGEVPRQRSIRTLRRQGSLERPSARWVFAAALAATTGSARLDESAMASAAFRGARPSRGSSPRPTTRPRVRPVHTTSTYAATSARTPPGSGTTISRGVQSGRVGYEYNLSLPLTQAVLSAQYASHGFFGGSVRGGRRLYGLLGISRTNESRTSTSTSIRTTVDLRARCEAAHDTSFMLYQIHGEMDRTAGQRVGSHARCTGRSRRRTRVCSIDAFLQVRPAKRQRRRRLRSGTDGGLGTTPHCSFGEVRPPSLGTRR